MKAGAMGIRDHPFFSGFDWKGLAERNCLLLMLVLLMHFNQNVRSQVLLPFACWCASWITAVTIKIGIVCPPTFCRAPTCSQFAHYYQTCKTYARHVLESVGV